MKKNFFIFSFVFGALMVFLSESVSAHCPLCVIGAGAAAAGAVEIGFSKVVIALFIGGFAMSMGLWMSRLVNKWVKRKFFKFQDAFLVLGIFLLTFVPLLPIFSQLHGYGIYLFGDYGSLFFRTYSVNLSLFAGFMGGILVFLSPKVSYKITSLRNGKRIKFQGTVVTILLLIIFGGIIQLVV